MFSFHWIDVCMTTGMHKDTETWGSGGMVQKLVLRWLVVGSLGEKAWQFGEEAPPPPTR